MCPRNWNVWKWKLKMDLPLPVLQMRIGMKRPVEGISRNCYTKTLYDL